MNKELTDQLNQKGIFITITIDYYKNIKISKKIQKTNMREIFYFLKNNLKIKVF